MNLLTPKEISDILGICLDNTYKLIKQKNFPKIMIGKRYFVDEKDLYEYIEKYKKSKIFLE